MLVSNQVQILPNCDNIVFLEGRRVRNVGTYVNLLNENDAFQQLVNDQWKEEEEEQRLKEWSTSLDAIRLVLTSRGVGGFQFPFP